MIYISCVIFASVVFFCIWFYRIVKNSTQEEVQKVSAVKTLSKIKKRMTLSRKINEEHNAVEKSLSKSWPASGVIKLPKKDSR